jgi:hypothetical protein
MVNAHGFAAAELLTQYEPNGHWTCTVLLVGQKFPAVQFKIEDVVGQYDPAGQGLAAVDLARQMFPDAHTVAADTPDPQYDPGGHWV